MNTLVSRDSTGAVNKENYQGLSTDAKPTTGIASGSGYYELDTGKIWVYDVNNVNSVTANGWWEV